MRLKAEGHEQYMPSANKPGPQSMLMFSNFDEIDVFNNSDQSSPYLINVEINFTECILTGLHFLACKSDFFSSLFFDIYSSFSIIKKPFT